VYSQFIAGSVIIADNPKRIKTANMLECLRLTEVKMKFWIVVFIRNMLLGICLVHSPVALSDQTDTRLDDLFITLQNSVDLAQLREAESSIWEIWFDSGEQEVDSMMEEARKAVGAREYAIAEEIYSQVITRLPAYSEGWNRRATIRFYRQDYDGSLQDIHRTLALEPRHFGAIWGLGMILGSQQEYGAAITAFERLLEIKPNSTDAAPRIEMLRQEMHKSVI
jgi:tetratricopeptide (TPR) repeat protein